MLEKRIGIFLSGGLDSRLLAGYAKKIADKTDIELISFTFGTKGGWQEKIAKKIAKRLNIENKFFEIPANSIANFAEEVVYKGDGDIRIRDTHFISQLNKVRNEVDTVLVGLFCSELYGETLSPKLLDITSKNELINYLFEAHDIKKISKFITNIFSKPFPIVSKSKLIEIFTKTIEEIP